MNIQVNPRAEGVWLPSIPRLALVRATKCDLAVLLAAVSLAADQETRDTVTPETVAQFASVPLEDARFSIDLWISTGILIEADSHAIPTPPPAKVPSTVAHADHSEQPTEASPAQAPAVGGTASMIPANAVAAEEKKPTRILKSNRAVCSYSTEEINAIMEGDAEYSANLRMCEDILGQVFYTPQLCTVIYLHREVGLDWDYLITLLSYTARQQDRKGVKRSLKAFETTAIEFYNDGVRTYDELHEHLQRLESYYDSESKIRAMLGIGGRALTPKEKKRFSAWVYDFKYDIPIIQLAFETTVDRSGRYSLDYMHAVLTNWHNENLQTIEEIEAADATHRAETERRMSESVGKAPRNRRAGSTVAPVTESSFDTENFFDAAVARSLGPDFHESQLTPEGKK